MYQLLSLLSLISTRKFPTSLPLSPALTSVASAECGPGLGAVGAQQADTDSGGKAVCGTGQGACCVGSNDGCPPDAPVCSEYGYCQCASYTPGGAECGPGFGSGGEGGGGGHDGASAGCGSIACGGTGVEDKSKCGGCWKRKRAALDILINKYQKEEKKERTRIK